MSSNTNNPINRKPSEIGLRRVEGDGIYKESYAYDSRNRRSQVIQHLSDTLSHSRTQVYDAAGNLISVTDAEGNTTTYEYDALNRVINVTKPDTKTIQYQYDNRDNLIRVTNENNIVLRVFAYDRLNRRVTETWPGGESFSSTYDANGNLLSKLDAKGQLTKYTYSAANRLDKTEHFASVSDTVPFKTVDYTYNKLGKLLTYNDGTTSGVYTYDDVQRKLSESVNYGIPAGQTVALQLGHSYSYTSNGRKHTFTGPDAVAYSYSYDAANRLSSIDLPGEGLFNVNAYTWHAPATITSPGGGNQNFAYDALMRLTNITDKDPAQNPVQQYNYAYDKVGNITSKGTEHGNYVYGYDNNYRLTSVDNPIVSNIPALIDEAYTYDAAGNRLTAANTTGSWVYNANNQLQSYNGITYTYGANGNTQSKLQDALTTTYVYDENDRLKDIKDNAGTVTASYYYDPFGRRLWKDVGGTRTYFVYADEGLVAEADSTGALSQHYGWSPDGLWGTNPLYTKTIQGYAYYLNDHLGTPQKLVNKSGATVWSAKYAAFGEAFIESNSITNNLRFAGQYYDAETGEHYNYFRNYNPGTGRYTTSDPIGLMAGLHTYGYVGGNPVGFTDSLGLAVDSVSTTCARDPQFCAMLGLGAAANAVVNSSGSDSGDGESCGSCEKGGAGAGVHASGLPVDVRLSECTYPKNNCRVVNGPLPTFHVGYSTYHYICGTAGPSQILARYIPSVLPAPSPAPCAPGYPTVDGAPPTFGKDAINNAMICRFRN